MPASYVESAEDFKAFVTEHAGGKHGFALKELITFERTLQVKRNIMSSDLMQLGKRRLPEAPRWVSCMIKAMLVSPTHQQGTCTLFAKSKLASVTTKLRAAIVESHKLLLRGHEFVSSHFMHTDVVVTTKVLSDVEVRLVMFTHNKTATTRDKFGPLMETARSFYDELTHLMEEQGATLTAWDYIETDYGKQTVSPECGLVETHWSGPIPDTLILDRGFNIGCKATEKGGEVGVMEAVAGDNVKLMQNDDTKKDLTKGELLSQWHVVKEAKRESYEMKDLPDPTSNNDLQADIWKGVILAALSDLYKEKVAVGVQCVRYPQVSVEVTTAIPKGSLTLVPLTRSAGTCSKGVNPHEGNRHRPIVAKKASILSMGGSNPCSPGPTRKHNCAICRPVLVCSIHARSRRY